MMLVCKEKDKSVVNFQNEILLYTNKMQIKNISALSI